MTILTGPQGKKGAGKVLFFVFGGLAAGGAVIHNSSCAAIYHLAAGHT